jgi:MurNAc alpha-1-phosphate uridylyltransferase
MKSLMPVVILAGGLATRLEQIAAKIPKSLLEIAGRPFLWHQLQLLKSHGVNRVILLVGHLGEAIQDRFADGADLGISLEYSFDGPVLLGTGGAIRRALPLLPEKFFVLYGDSYLRCDYFAVQEAFLKSRREALMTVYRNEGHFDISNVEFDGASILRYDKKDTTPAMHHADYGLGVFNRNVFAVLPPEQQIDLAAVYQDLLRKGQLAALEVPERFWEIGSVQGIRDTTRLLSQH